jgi:threonine dehydrogenase-like Zn-dependent dehydrogenase
MQGAAFGGHRTIEMIDVPDPAPGPGDVVLAVKASGLCGSDLHYYRSATGSSGPVAAAGNVERVVAGHEPCGEVVAVGAGVARAQAHVGLRAIVHHYAGCTACDHCRSGWPQMCSGTPPTIYGINAHGGHAPYLKVPAHTLVPLPSELSFAAGAALACGTGTAYAALARLGLTGRDTIAIFGQGPVGLAATQLAVAQGAQVIALDVKPERLARAREFGAMHSVDAAGSDVVARLHELTQGGPRLALDTSGAGEARALALRSVAAWGKVALVGAGGELRIAVADIMRRQVEVMASWTFSTCGLAECARFVAQRKVDVERVYTHRWSLAQAAEAYAWFDRQDAGKGVICP